MTTAGRPRKNPLPPAPGSVALISPQQYLDLSGLGPGPLAERMLDGLASKAGVRPVDRKTLERIVVGKASLRSGRNLVKALRPFSKDEAPDWLLEMERAVETPEAWKASNQPVTGPQALEGWLAVSDWRVFRKYWLPKPDPARLRNSDFFRSHLLPMQEASWMATRLQFEGDYAGAVDVLVKSPLGPYVDFGSFLARLGAVTDAVSFSDRMMPVRLLSALFVLAVLEHEVPHDPEEGESALADLVPLQGADGNFERPFGLLLILAEKAAGRNLLVAEDPETTRKRRQRWLMPSTSWTMPEPATVATLWRETNAARGLPQPGNLHQASERIYRDLHLLTELGRIVATTPRQFHTDGFNGFFGMYRTMYDDMAAAPRTKAPPPGG